MAKAKVVYPSFKLQQFLAEGKRVEKFVSEIIEEKLGGTCEEATAKEDMLDHIDVWWHSPKRGRLSLDIKGLKKNKRTDKEFSDNQWIELKNVNGKPGWVFGKEDYVAFLTKRNLLFVQPERLIEQYVEKVQDKEVVNCNPHDFYVPYQRYGRQDLIFKMPNEDLEKIAHFVVEFDGKQSF